MLRPDAHVDAAWPLRRWLLAASVLLALTWLSGLVLLALSGWFITASALAGAGLLLGLEVFLPSAGIRAAALSRTLARYGERVIGHETVLRGLARLRGDTFARIAALPAQLQQRVRSGDWLGRLGADIERLDALPLRVWMPVLAATGLLAAGTALVAWLAPAPGAGWIVGTGAAVMLAAAFAARGGRVAGAEVVAAQHAERIAVLDHLQGHAELRVFDGFEASSDDLERRDAGLARLTRGQAAIAGWAEQATHALVWLSALGMLAMALGWWRSGEVSAPVAVLLALLQLGLAEALVALPGAGWRKGEADAARTRLESLLADADEAGQAQAGPPPAIATPSPAPGLAWRSLEVGFAGARALALSDASVAPGCPLLLVGPSGSGKSTVLATLAGELPPRGGQVWLDGRPVADLEAADVAFVAQDTGLLDASIEANLRLARPGVSPQEASGVLRGLGLGMFAPGAARGWRLRVGEDAANLSGGEARRLLLAWLMVRAPRLALLDEPLQGLDDMARATVIDSLVPWLEQRVAVIATHEPDAWPAHWPRQRFEAG